MKFYECNISVELKTTWPFSVGTRKMMKLRTFFWKCRKQINYEWNFNLINSIYDIKQLKKIILAGEKSRFFPPKFRLKTWMSALNSLCSTLLQPWQLAMQKYKSYQIYQIGKKEVKILCLQLTWSYYGENSKKCLKKIKANKFSSYKIKLPKFQFCFYTLTMNNLQITKNNLW